jgi:hypothetical protein
MNLQQRTSAFVELGKQIRSALTSRDNANRLFNPGEVFAETQASNQWFTAEFTKKALEGLAEMLDEEKLKTWLATYPWLFSAHQASAGNTVVGIVMAGNLPAVGFHDMLCALIAGYRITVRLSSKDNMLPRRIAAWLTGIEPAFSPLIQFAEGPLTDADAIIATGSNNTGRYFEFYFGRKPHIFRKNRYSIAILDGKEHPEALKALGEDIFSYFGMGCRNVSKIFVPEGYPPEQLIEAFLPWKQLALHSKYHNNYEYNKAIALINREAFLDGNFFILKPSSAISPPPPLSVLYFTQYRHADELHEPLELMRDNLQCIVHDGRFSFAGIKPGQAQYPGPSDYADGADTLEFLRNIRPAFSNAE